MSTEHRQAEPANSESDKQWVDAIRFEVLGNLRTDFTLMTYTNQPSRNHDRQPE